MILVIDNHDSFTWNLVQLVRALGAEVRVEFSDAIDLAGVHASGATHVIVSPGPCGPMEAGVSVAAIAHARVPTLGVCLGHQCLAAAFGGHVVRAPSAIHGRASHIVHDGTGLFTGLDPHFEAARYHSLIVARDSLPDVLEATAFTDDGLVMALRHRTRALAGVQFHPESVLTPDGPRVVANFLAGRV